MLIPSKSLRSGFTIPVYGLGTWEMGGRSERDPNTNETIFITAIQQAVESGITHIDTAEMYGAGYAEEIIQKALKPFDRKKLFITSKVLKRNAHYNDVLTSCKASLKRLGTDYLDLYLIHAFNETVPLSETVQALDELVASGLVKNIGVSNFSVAHLAEAQLYSKNKIVCNQVHYNVEYREPEAAGLLKYCQDNDIFLTAWRPVGKGTIPQSPPAILSELGRKYHKTPVQIAINWLISQPNVVTLAKTTSLDHLTENLGAIGWNMDSVDIERLRRDYPDQKNISNAVPLK